MVLIHWIHNGIWWHDVYLGENQVAYTEDLQIQDPEKVTLWFKSTNVITTWNNLAMSALFGNEDYYWCETWKVYDETGTIVLDTWVSRSIIWLVRAHGWTVYFSDTNDLWYLDYTDTLGSTDWTAEASYVYPVWSQNAMYSYILDWDDIVAGSVWGFYRILNAAPWTIVSLSTSNWWWIGIWKTTNYFNLFSSDWEHYYSAWSSSLASALNILDGEYKKAFYKEWLQWCITSWLPENSKLYAIGENKQLLASARLSTADNKKAFYFWRNDVESISFNWMGWQDTTTSIQNYIYFVASNGVISYWSEYPWLNKAWNVLTTKNYNNDVIEDVWFVKPVEQSDGTIRVYYSWRVATTCWVDYIDLSSTTYKDSGVFYSQKYINKDIHSWQKYKIQKIKTRANTDTDATINIYISRDGGAFELVGTLNNTNQKQAHLINKHYEWHEIQWKFVLATTDNTKTPEFRSFSFSMERIDG